MSGSPAPERAGELPEREQLLRLRLRVLLRPDERLIRMPPASSLMVSNARRAALTCVLCATGSLVGVLAIDVRPRTTSVTFWVLLGVTGVLLGVSWVMWRASLRRVVLTDRRLIVVTSRPDGRRMWSRTVLLEGSAYAELHEWCSRWFELGSVVLRDTAGKRLRAVGPIVAPREVCGVTSIALAATVGTSAVHGGIVKSAIRVFICYRRTDTREWAAPLKRQLAVDLPEASIFLDTDDFRAGANYAAATRDLIPRSTVVIVLIGKGFPKSFRRDGEEVRHDAVLDEIRLALEAKVPVIPVLIDRTRLPRKGTLPDAIGPLAGELNYVTMPAEPHFVDGVRRLANHIRAWHLDDIASARPRTNGSDDAGSQRWQDKTFNAVADALAVAGDSVPRRALLNVALYIEQHDVRRRVLEAAYGEGMKLEEFYELIPSMIAGEGWLVDASRLEVLQSLLTTLLTVNCVAQSSPLNGTSPSERGGTRFRVSIGDRPPVYLDMPAIQYRDQLVEPQAKAELAESWIESESLALEAAGSLDLFAQHDGESATRSVPGPDRGSSG